MQISRTNLSKILLPGTLIIILASCSQETKPKQSETSLTELPVPVVSDNPDCVEFVALWSAAEIAQQLNKSKKWVFMNYTVDLWENPYLEDNGKKLGMLRASSYARLVATMMDYYLVESPIDGAEGWVHKKHVKGTVKKNPATKALCE